jgi:flagellar FliL protein
MAKSNTKEATDVSAEAPTSNKKKIRSVRVIISAVVLALIAGGAWYYFQQKKPSEHKVEHVSPPVFVVLEPFTLNLHSEDVSEQYLQIGMTAQVINTEQADMMKTYMPQIRSRLLTLLSSKKASDISSESGKRALIKDILDKIREPYTVTGPGQLVSDVFFTSFLIQ